MNMELWYEYLWCGESLSTILNPGDVRKIVIEQKNIDDYEGMISQVVAHTMFPEKVMW